MNKFTTNNCSSESPHWIPSRQNDWFLLAEDFVGAELLVDDDLEHELPEPVWRHQEVALRVDLRPVGVLDAPFGHDAVLGKQNKKSLNCVLQSLECVNFLLNENTIRMTNRKKPRKSNVLNIV